MAVPFGLRFAIPLVALLGLAGCFFDIAPIVGSGVIVGESYDLAGFDRLKVEGLFDVTVLQGEGYAVEVSADDNLLEHVRVVQRDGELLIGFTSRMRLQNATLIAVVHLPELTAATVEGASRLRIPSLQADRLELEVSGASQVEGEVSAGQLALNLHGASRAQLAGHVGTLVAGTYGASDAQLGQLVAAQSSTIDANGASRARVHADGELSMVATGASNVSYTGTATVTRSEAHGASSIRAE